MFLCQSVIGRNIVKSLLLFKSAWPTQWFSIVLLSLHSKRVLSLDLIRWKCLFTGGWGVGVLPQSTNKQVR